IPDPAVIRPWPDPILDADGFDPRSIYVEKFWLGVIGPTALWIMRRFADLLDVSPQGRALDLRHTATTMGLSFKDAAPTSPFGRAIGRCALFGLVHPQPDGFAVRRR